MPDYYNDPNELPDDMPADLQTVIRETKEEERNQVWVSCDGLTSADKELINGNIEYFPGRGLPEYFYPYRYQRGYLSPLIAVRLARPLSKLQHRFDDFRVS